MNTREIEPVVASYADAMHDLDTRVAQASWDLATTGSDATRDRLVALEVHYKALFERTDDLATIRGWYHDRKELEDQGMRRQLDHLYRAAIANHEDPELSRAIAALSSAVRNRYTTFRATHRGRRVGNNEILDILRTDTNSDNVKQAWAAGTQIGRAVCEEVLLLVERRNQAARALGFETHVARSLAAQELDPQELVDLLTGLEQDTREPYRAAKSRLDATLSRRFSIPVDELRPWHYGQPFFQRTPPADRADDALFAGHDPLRLARLTYDGLGLDVADILARSDLYERDHKDQNAFCTHIDRLSDDVRVLCNLRPTRQWTSTLLHELGHAVYDKYLDPDLPFLLRDVAHNSSTEAIALLMGRLTRDPAWLSGVMDVPPARAGGWAAGLREEQRLGLLIFMRWALVVVHFERALYDNPRRGDLNTLWWDLVERFQLLQRPERRDEPDWAAKIHLALYPVYYQNYILGELMAAQIQHALRIEVGGVVNNPPAGEWLRERIFKPGARYPWGEALERATGEPLRTMYFAEQVAR